MQQVFSLYGAIFKIPLKLFLNVTECEPVVPCSVIEARPGPLEAQGLSLCRCCRCCCNLVAMNMQVTVERRRLMSTKSGRRRRKQMCVQCVMTLQPHFQADKKIYFHLFPFWNFAGNFPESEFSLRKHLLKLVIFSPLKHHKIVCFIFNQLLSEERQHFPPIKKSGAFQ